MRAKWLVRDIDTGRPAFGIRDNGVGTCMLGGPLRYEAQMRYVLDRLECEITDEKCDGSRVRFFGKLPANVAPLGWGGTFLEEEKLRVILLSMRLRIEAVKVFRRFMG